MCGEHEKILLYGDAIPGSSPHVRGAPFICSCSSFISGIIPACAGSTFRLSRVVVWRGDHPRMCGEHVLYIGNVTGREGSSPHVRGAPR